MKNNQARARVYIAPPYIYALPLRRWLRKKGYVVLVYKPIEAIKAILDSDEWLGIVPLASAITNKNLKICPGPMIYSIGETKSVIVVSTKYTDIDKCKKIAVTAETRTSIYYLKHVLSLNKLNVEYIYSHETSLFQLLSQAPCALILADEALRARKYKLNIVADIGSLVSKVLGISPVYAVTATKNNSICDSKLSTDPPPSPSSSDVELATYITGLDKNDIVDYYETIQYNYNPGLLLRAKKVLERIVAE